MTIQTIIADDEVLARQKLRHLLEDEADVEIVGEGATAQETIELATMTDPDLILLDIQMPGMDGFDVVSALCSKKAVACPRIIFTTAFDKYALRAFEINAVDYLLKPFTRERLQQAMERVREQLALHNDGVKPARRTDEPYTTRIVFKSRGRILFLPISDIRWVGAEENYVRICTERENHLLRETMANFESRLDPKSFIRVHRSAIVNLQYVKEIRTDSLEGESYVLMKDGQKVPVSRGYKARITGLLAR
ncbi:LytTR family DNA-binding domain-containing protein [Alloacidobacterium sp.]|uniref:LytR/AlgR family response regulator transcription factor n=1 Tax=Alloacidobacterium sp. TaxID=2951999 RepID=UPI002D4EC870|nr:LytTR family DNA-binding domain-containing protein [Alloacidobacterium sp.]HYK34676.1 LytTR family DNA-binding domain-containing protein [Alloacidobacterium sp.]